LEIDGFVSTSIPENLDPGLVDEFFEVSLPEAAKAARMLARKEGIIAGISTGANILASLEVARRLGPGKVVVTIAADTGFKYASTLYNDSWLLKFG